MKKNNNKYFGLFLRTFGIVLFIILAKLVAHYFNLEFLSLNPFFPGIVAANVFIMGFLLSGVLADYKESERLPGELASSIYVIVDETMIIYKSKKAPSAKECLIMTHELAESIKKWFHKDEKTIIVMNKIFLLSDYFLSYESLTQANFITRLKQEQNNIRRIITRIHTIRETDFISAGYYIAAAMTILLSLGLVLSKIDPFYESLFFVGVISFFLVYLLLLIKDLDNPFGYYENSSVEDVSLKPLEVLMVDLKNKIETIEKEQN